MSKAPPEESAHQPVPAGTGSDSGLDLEDFTYKLPEELIAQEPLPVRHESRLLFLRRESGAIAHRKFGQLPGLLQPGDVLIVNDTRVLPARLLARRSSGGAVQLLLIRPAGDKPNLWQAMASPLRKLKAKEVLTLEPAGSQSGSIEIVDVIAGEDGHKRLIVDLGPPQDVHALLARSGYAPLPPYIQRDANVEQRASDLDRYQTVFARAPGAVAAPTAGLHFSHEVMEALEKRGVEIASLTLHVGPGTFKPMSGPVSDHKIEPERFSIPERTAEIVNRAIAERRRVIAVGTTSCRALESAVAGGRLQAIDEAETSLYIRPGHAFRIVKGLVTNFHLSRSSLLVLVCAFAGHEATMRAYKEAVARRYRFYSYGDAMLIL